MTDFLNGLNRSSHLMRVNTMAQFRWYDLFLNLSWSTWRKIFNIIKLFILSDKLQDLLCLKKFVGKSLTVDCAKHLHQDQKMSDFYNALH